MTMSKPCNGCGKPLSFFEGLFHALCEDCRDKISNIQNPEKEQIKSNPLRRNMSRIGGELEYYNLQDWWIKNFSHEEQDTILSIYKPMGFRENGLIEGKISSSSQSVVGFLSGLAGWFKKPEYRQIGYKILEKGESLISEKTKIMDQQFFYQVKMENYYRNRDNDEFALPSAIDACRQQIGLSKKAKRAFLREYKDSLLPSHAGYNQLCIIFEKQKKYDDAISLAAEAKEQGWAGDWDQRIEKCMKKKNSKNNQKLFLSTNSHEILSLSLIFEFELNNFEHQLPKLRIVVQHSVPGALTQPKY